jgi:hypothetical protein
MPSRNVFSRWSWRRPAIRKTCWIWISTSKRTSASTPSNKRKCSRPSERHTTFHATRIRKLRDYPTLAHVIRFVYEKRPDLVAAAAALQLHNCQRSQLCPRRRSPINRRQTMPLPRKCWRSWPRRPAIPKDMLDLDLDLEADLGVDTVKQAEMFAAVRAAYNIPRDENLKLRDFPTLASVIKFARDRQPGIAKDALTGEYGCRTPSNESNKKNLRRRRNGSSGRCTASSRLRSRLRLNTRPIPASFDAANRIPRRVPVANLRPPLAAVQANRRDARLGQRVVRYARQVWRRRRAGRTAAEFGRRSSRIDQTLDAEALANRLKELAGCGSGAGSVLAARARQRGRPREHGPGRLARSAAKCASNRCTATMRILYEQVATPGTFLVSATRLGGQHGYDDAGATAPSRWRGHGLHQDLQARAAGRSGQGRRLRSGTKAIRNRRHPD